MNYDIRDLNTSKFLYDPQDPSEIKRLKSEIPEFGAIPTNGGKKIKPALDHGAVINYVLLMYDKESQLRREYPKIRQRKIAAAQYAGFKIIQTQRAFRKDVEDILIGQSPEVNQMIVKYVMSYNDPDQMALEMYTEMFQRNAALMLQSIADAAEYKRMHDITERLKNSIDELTKKALGGQDEASIRKELYAELERLRESMMPEYIADKRSRGEDLEYSPYGGYKAEPLRLVQQDHEFKADEE